MHARKAAKARCFRRAQVGNRRKPHRRFERCADARLAADSKIGCEVLDFVAAKVEENVARLERAVELLQNIRRAQDHPRAAVPP
eukprot:4221530-Pleurochrysis_carterae.AAC.1